MLIDKKFFWEQILCRPLASIKSELEGNNDSKHMISKKQTMLSN
jgi:hypothetical protein